MYAELTHYLWITLLNKFNQYYIFILDSTYDRGDSNKTN